MKRIILLTEKNRHVALFEKLKIYLPNCEWHLINNKADFNLQELSRIEPDFVFIPHWSYIISREIYLQYNCVVFHMTDLPYGRGGSPLQNLILYNHKKTKISAIKIVEEIDAGDVYLKRDLYLCGTAEEILIRASQLIFEMIIDIVEGDIEAIPQVGEIVKFKRRKPEDGNIENLESLEDIYNYIRMLDGEGYPNAFIDLKNYRLEFSRASIITEKTILADVRIIKK